MQNNNQRRSPSHGTSEGTTYEGTALEMISIKDTVAPQKIYIYIFYEGNNKRENIYNLCLGEHSLFLPQCPNVPLILSAPADAICTQLCALFIALFMLSKEE